LNFVPIHFRLELHPNNSIARKYTRIPDVPFQSHLAYKREAGTNTYSVIGYRVVKSKSPIQYIIITIIPRKVGPLASYTFAKPAGNYFQHTEPTPTIYLNGEALKSQKNILATLTYFK